MVLIDEYDRWYKKLASIYATSVGAIVVCGRYLCRCKKMEELFVLLLQYQVRGNCANKSLIARIRHVREECVVTRSVTGEGDDNDEICWLCKRLD